MMATKHYKGVSKMEMAYLKEGLEQPSGKLPLFDKGGQEINTRIVRSCIKKGFAERWFANPLKPEWLVCKLTQQGREAISK